MNDHLYKSVLTETQREAAAVAFLDRGIRPARRICELAAAGELELDGAKLEPYEISQGQVRHQAAVWRRKRSGVAHSRLAGLPAADAVEELRRRLVRRADIEMRALERDGPRATEKSVERAARVAKLVREIAALPAPKENPRSPVSPGRTGGRDPAPTSLAGQVLKAQRGVGYERPEPPPEPVSEPEPELDPERAWEESVAAWARQQLIGANGYDHLDSEEADDGAGQEGA